MARRSGIVALLGPNVHADLLALDDGQAGVQDADVANGLAGGVLAQVGPVDGVALDGLEGDAAVVLVVALDELAPGVAGGRLELGEGGAAANNVVADGDVGEEAGDAVAAAGDVGVAAGPGGVLVEPVGVVLVLLAGVVADELDGLEVGDGLVEALEAAGALADAGGDGVGGDGGGGGGAGAVDGVAVFARYVGARKGAVSGQC